jgi:hypothetical protein
MKPEEKADYFISCFKRYDFTEHDFEFAIDHAIFCVDQIINEINEIDSILSEGGLLNQNLKYWQEVKKEIQLYDITN